MSEKTFYTCDAYELNKCSVNHDKDSPSICVLNITPRRSDWIWCGDGRYSVSTCSNTIGPEGSNHWHRTCEFAKFSTYRECLSSYRISVWEVDFDPRSAEGGQLPLPFMKQERKYRERYD